MLCVYGFGFGQQLPFWYNLLFIFCIFTYMVGPLLD